MWSAESRGGGGLQWNKSHRWFSPSVDDDSEAALFPVGDGSIWAHSIRGHPETKAGTHSNHPHHRHRISDKYGARAAWHVSTTPQLRPRLSIWCIDTVGLYLARVFLHNCVTPTPDMLLEPTLARGIIWCWTVPPDPVIKGLVKLRMLPRPFFCGPFCFGVSKVGDDKRSNFWEVQMGFWGWHTATVSTGRPGKREDAYVMSDSIHHQPMDLEITLLSTKFRLSRHCPAIQLRNSVTVRTWFLATGILIFSSEAPFTMLKFNFFSTLFLHNYRARKRYWIWRECRDKHKGLREIAKCTDTQVVRVDSFKSEVKDSCCATDQ